MRRPDEDMNKMLDRLLRKVGDPDNDQMEQSIGSVAQSLRSAVVESQGQMEPARDRVGMRRRRTLAFAFAAIAVTVVITLTATVWKSASPVASSADGNAKGGEENVMTLEDGSRIERRADSEVSVERVADGLRIRLKAGSIIVNAAKQAAGRHLYVVTKDVTVSVLGTVFFVKSDEKGSRVGVIEGVVNVKHGTVEKNLQPGEQMSSNPSNPSNPSSKEHQELALQAEIGWSRDAAAHLAQFAARQDSPRTTSVSAKPQFEVVSVRPCEENFQRPPGARGGGGGGNSFRMSPGRLDAWCVDIGSLISWAHGPLAINGGTNPLGGPLGGRLDMTYGIGFESGNRVRGGPDWMRSEKYTIAAVAQGSPDGPTMQGPMLMALLEDRFRLKLHVESEEIPVWELKVAKDGLKIKPVEPFGCPPQPIINAEERRKYEESRGTKIRCGFSMQNALPPNLRVSSVGHTIGTLARTLNRVSREMLMTTLGGTPVVDKTGIPETQGFDYVFEFPYDPEYPLQHRGEGIPMVRGTPGATIFKAIEPLGLTLERARGPREFIVIDNIERPSPN